MPKADSLHMNGSSDVYVDAGKTFKLSKGVHILTWTCTIIHLSSFYIKIWYNRGSLWNGDNLLVSICWDTEVELNPEGLWLRFPSAQMQSWSLKPTGWTWVKVLVVYIYFKKEEEDISIFYSHQVTNDFPQTHKFITV